MKRILSSALLLVTLSSQAAPEIHRGQTLHTEKCVTCHAEKSGLGNGDLLYTRTDRRVNDLRRLESMVARCNSELRLDLFPEDEADLVIYLQRQYYRFGDSDTRLDAKN